MHFDVTESGIFYVTESFIILLGMHTYPYMRLNCLQDFDTGVSWTQNIVRKIFHFLHGNVSFDKFRVFITPESSHIIHKLW